MVEKRATEQQALNIIAGRGGAEKPPDPGPSLLGPMERAGVAFWLMVAMAALAGASVAAFRFLY